MRLQQNPSFHRITEILRIQFRKIADEPLPERWVDLIKRLNENELRNCARNRRTVQGADSTN